MKTAAPAGSFLAFSAPRHSSSISCTSRFDCAISTSTAHAWLNSAHLLFLAFKINKSGNGLLGNIDSDRLFHDPAAGKTAQVLLPHLCHLQAQLCNCSISTFNIYPLTLSGPLIGHVSTFSKKKRNLHKDSMKKNMQNQQLPHQINRLKCLSDNEEMQRGERSGLTTWFSGGIKIFPSEERNSRAASSSSGSAHCCDSRVSTQERAWETQTQ